MCLSRLLWREPAAKSHSCPSTVTELNRPRPSSSSGPHSSVSGAHPTEPRDGKAVGVGETAFLMLPKSVSNPKGTSWAPVPSWLIRTALAPSPLGPRETRPAYSKTKAKGAPSANGSEATGTASPITVVPLALTVTGLPDRASVPAAERSNRTLPCATALYVQLKIMLWPAGTSFAGPGPDWSVTPPVPETAIEGCTPSASTIPGLSSWSETVNVSFGSAPGGIVGVASRMATAAKMITIHCTGPTLTWAPPVESVPAPLQPSVAVPSLVPLAVQTKVRVAPAGMSCGSGEVTSETMAGAVSGSKWTPSASEPPSLVTSTEIWNGGPAGCVGGAVGDENVRCAGVTMGMEMLAAAVTGLPSTSSVPANGRFRSRRPGAVARTRQTKTWESPAAMSVLSGGATTAAGGPAITAAPAPTARAAFPPAFVTVTATAISSPTSARGGADVDSKSTAGTPSRAWNAPSMAP